MRPQLVVSDKRGKIYNIPHLIAAGMKGGYFFSLTARDLIKLPFASELFMLPQRAPVGYNPKDKNFTTFDNLSAVAAFISPGFTVTHNSSYIEKKGVKILPLFSYGAAAFYKGGFYAAAVRVDRDKRQDLRFMDIRIVKKGIRRLKKLFPFNRLIRHLEGCALSYGCPAAKNFFLKRYEAPLPVSPYCNARCLGCISYQPGGSCSITQPRIKFRPGPREVAEVALYHIENVRDPVVSFGQGCEGEPLLAGKLLKESIKIIRTKTSKGVINLNTNASRPDVVGRLFDTGLDSIRVSLNSVRSDYYSRYYRPKGYKFSDVTKSILTAKKRGGFVSMNYLTMPGFTDSSDEVNAFEDFLKRHRIDMVQWRNLNYDPVRYFKKLKIEPDNSKMLGIRQVITLTRKNFPRLMTGYFNPSKARMKTGNRPRWPLT